MHVIATAGHVDHGKSTLVRLLTGMEPDRWAEERRRGLTIDLGFAWTTLPGRGEVAFVDVPGHERFVPNMLAGVGPVPAVMVVVAADEGWMPQSAEHVAALDALGVRHGLLVVSRSDLADPEPARRQALAELARTSLGRVPSVVVSGLTGRGLPELRAALERLVDTLPPADPAADVRLWVDRSFSIRGAGTVVTGTLPGGTLRVGDELELSRTGQRVRVRGLQTLGREVDRVTAVARVAVNLRGVDREAVSRGDALLTPGAWPTTEVVDVALRGDEDLPRMLVLHVGAAAVPARVRPLRTGTARLVLSRALPLRVGDRALLRDPGRHRIAAGVEVLDTAPPAFTRRGAARARAAELAEALARSGPERQVALATLRLRHQGIVPTRELRAAGLPEVGTAVAPGWRADPERWAHLVARAAEEVDGWQRAHPLDPGIPEEVLRQRLGLLDGTVLRALADAAGLVPRAGRLGRPGATRALPPEVTRALCAVEADLRAHPFRAPEADRLAELGLDPVRLAAATRAGLLLKVTDGVYLLPGADARAVEVLAELPQPFTVSQARRALDTTRRVAVPLLELLDRQHRTVRLADGTRQVRNVPQDG